jgi:hypothetical protein
MVTNLQRITNSLVMPYPKLLTKFTLLRSIYFAEHFALERIFLLAPASRPALGPTQPPVQWVPGVLSPGGKARPGRDADHSPPSSAEVKYE